MDIKERVLGIRSGTSFDTFQKYFLENPKQIEALVDILINENSYPLPEYASWIIVHLSKSQKTELIQFQNKLIDFLFINQNESVRRNVLNIQKHLGITLYKESEFIDLLISYIQNYEEKVAVQVYSMQLLVSFVKKYPELKTELLEIIELNSEKKTPAYYSAQRHFVKKTIKF